MAKVLFDRVFAFAGLVLLAPLFLIIALLIICLMPDGPILFRQQRVGRNGDVFTICKFRTMRSGSMGGSVTVAGDSRITPLGSFLRWWKLDELPELWNVLIGDMSFVGPRPDVPGYADRLNGDDRRLLRLLPGITGPATLKYRDEEVLLSTVDNPLSYNDEVIFPDKVRLNLYYYDHPSFTDDLKMIYCTVFNKRMRYAGELI